MVCFKWGCPGVAGGPRSGEALQGPQGHSYQCLLQPQHEAVSHRLHGLLSHDMALQAPVPSLQVCRAQGE